MMFQMRIYITVVFLFPRGTLRVVFEKVWGQAELIADIYQQFPRGCISIIYLEALQQGED
jgi:hypothetical protein